MAQAIDCMKTRECSSYLSESCATCAHNKRRNAPKNWYTRANDKELKGAPMKGDAYVANKNAKYTDILAYDCPACGENLWIGPKSMEGMPLVETYCPDCGLKVVIGHL